MLAVVAALGVASGRAKAESPPEKIRFDFFEDEFGRFRFDRSTGDVQKMVRAKNGIVWESVSAEVSEKSPTAAAKAKSDDVKSMATISEPAIKDRKKDKSPIVLLDKDGKDLTYVVSDDMRAAAVPEIAGYEKDMAVMLAVTSDDTISGVMTLRNRGERRIEVLEVTMFVPVNGKELPDQHHFLFVDSRDPRPPQPGAGKDGLPLLQKVSLPCPAGGVKGNPELKITYIKFAN
jgi:hypothetical protein